MEISQDCGADVSDLIGGLMPWVSAPAPQYYTL